MILETVGWVILALIGLSALRFGLRAHRFKWAARGYETGHKLGRVSALCGQDVKDQMLRDAGIDPAKLPGRSS